MTQNKILLSSLALDLRRIALAYHRGSDKVGDRFVQETKRWINDVNINETPDYIKKLISDLDNNLYRKDKQKIAEDSLMYSTLLQNYSTM